MYEIKVTMENLHLIQIYKTKYHWNFKIFRAIKTSNQDSNLLDIEIPLRIFKETSGVAENIGHSLDNLS